MRLEEKARVRKNVIGHHRFQLVGIRLGVANISRVVDGLGERVLIAKSVTTACNTTLKIAD